METDQRAFRISLEDNVATALVPLEEGQVRLLGDSDQPFVTAVEKVPLGHKIALRNIAEDEDIIKYGVVIGRATSNIPSGSWVHLHVMRSIYDERSSHLDAKTGVPKDTRYE